jgi:1,4-dihydroxy-2-naphthoate octaprenyltransferase
LVSLGFIAFLWLYILKFRDQPLVIRNQEIPEKVVTLFCLIVTALMIYISSAGSVIWKLIVISFGIVVGHALFYTPEPVDEFGFGFGDSTGNNAFASPV